MTQKFFRIQIFAILYIRIYSINSIMLVYLNNNVLFYKFIYLSYFITQNNERLVILGDAAYPALPWLVKPWPGVNLSLKKELFNFRYSSARMAIEQAFGLLKSRWRILLKRQDTEFHNLHYCITACFILHNICIDQGDNHLPLWDDNIDNNVYNEIEGQHVNIFNGDNNMRNYITNIL